MRHDNFHDYIQKLFSPQCPLLNHRSKYTLDGEKRFAAITFLCSTDARRAFPCWDEPALKATFEIKISAPKNRVVLSNMPLIKESKDDEEPDIYRYIGTMHFKKTRVFATL